MSINNNDISSWALRLKGNFKKGVNLLDFIMQVPATANEFIEDGSGLLCVYGVKDRNSQELANVIEKHGYGDKAITRYLNILFGWSHANFAAIAASSTAMTAVMTNATAREAFFNSSYSVGLGIATYAGITDATLKGCATMAAVAASSTAMTAVAASSTAMTAVIANATALSAVVASSTAMTAVAASSTAMTAVAANTTACQAVEASSVAKTALFNSPLAQTLTGQAATNSWTNRRSGKVWLIWHKQSWGNDTNTLQVRYTVVGNSTISNTNAQTYNTDCRVDRFMTGIENYNSAGGIGSVVSYRFIPC